MTSGSELGFFEFENFLKLFECNIARTFPTRAASIPYLGVKLVS